MPRGRNDICYYCQYWLGHGAQERGPKGSCRRYPPVCTDRAPDGSFPVTLSTDWCGEWRRNTGQASRDEDETMVV